MADEEIEEEGGKKSSLLKIILLAVILLVIIGGAIGATLFLTGFFKKEPVEEAAGDAGARGVADAHGAAADGHGAADKADKHATDKPAGPPESREPPPEPAKRVTKASPERPRFEYRYFELDKPLQANLTGSRKVMQVQIVVMTRYDERVTENVKKHEFALRSAALDILRRTTDADLPKPDFRKVLAETLRTEFNAVLEKFEDFGGIEEVYFSAFVVQ